LDDVSLKFAYDIDKFDRTFNSKDEEWEKKGIGELFSMFKKIQCALESLFSSPIFDENFTLKPKICPQEKEYSTPTTY